MGAELLVGDPPNAMMATSPTPRGAGQDVFRRLAKGLTARTGSATAAVLVVCGAVAWLALGLISGFPRWWELLGTGGVPLLTFLMVVLLQHTQNHDALATQLKLDELIRATHGATNRMMTVEEASPKDLDRIQADFRSQSESALRQSPSGLQLP